MTSSTPSDRKAFAEKVAERTGGFAEICGACKQRLSDEDVGKIKSIAAELKSLSGSAFGAGRHVVGYRLRDLSKALDAILFGRK